MKTNEGFHSVLSRCCSKRLNDLIIALVATLVACLAACQGTTPTIIQNEARLPEQVALGDAEIIMLEHKLAEKGVQIVSIGQDYLLSVPAATLFGDQSPHLTWASYDELNEIACYLRQFRKVGVSVTAYTSPYVSPHREHALSEARAREVANYLWSQGIDSRLIFADGLASVKPLLRKASLKLGDKSPNSRIEITFRRAIA